MVEDARLIGVLKLFENIPGEKIIPTKSSIIISMNVSQEIKNEIAKEFDISLANVMGKHLGIPIKKGGNLVAQDVDFILDKINAKSVG